MGEGGLGHFPFPIEQEQGLTWADEDNLTSIGDKHLAEAPVEGEGGERGKGSERGEKAAINRQQATIGSKRDQHKKWKKQTGNTDQISGI